MGGGEEREGRKEDLPERCPPPVIVPASHGATKKAIVHRCPRVPVNGKDRQHLRLVHMYHGVRRNHLGGERRKGGRKGVRERRALEVPPWGKQKSTGMVGEN